MKNVFKMIAIAMMMVTVFSCEKDGATEDAGEKGSTITFTAYLLGTRAGFNEGKLTWETGDQIAVCDGATVEVVKLTADDIKPGGVSAVIQTSKLAPDAKEYYAVFPAACAYTEVKKSELNTFITNDGSIQISTGDADIDKSQTFKSYAITSEAGGHLMFESVDAIVYLKTERTDIASVQFKSNKSGLVKSNILIDPRTKKIYHNGYNGAHDIEYKLNGEKEAYIPVCAKVTFEGGYTLTAYDSSNNVIGTISTSADISFENGKYYTIKDFDSCLVGELPGMFTVSEDGD